MIQEMILKVKAINRQLFRSLGFTLLFWFLTLSIIPVVIIAWYGYAHTVKSVDEMQRNKLTNTAVLNVATLNENFYGAAKNLRIWSQLRAPKDVLSLLHERYTKSSQNLYSFIHSEEYEKFIKNQPETILTLSKEYDYVYDLFLIDLDGNILYTIKKESDLGTNLLNGLYSKTRFAQTYRRSLADGKVHFSDLERYAPSADALTGFITQPILDNSGKMVGIIGLQLNMNVLFDSLKDKREGVSQYLVGADGLLRSSVGDSDEVLKRRISTKVFWNWYNEHGIHGQYPDGMSEKASFYIGPNGKKVLGEHRSINLMGIRWVHISEMDESEVLAIPNHLFTMIIIFSLIVTGVVVFVGIMIARRIVKPIELLSEASKQYMNGTKEVYVSVEAANEIGELGSVFNALIEKQESDEEKLNYLAQKAQKTLDELKEQKYALDAHSIVAITDVKGTITFVNSKFEEISGYKSDELIGKNHRLLNSGLHGIEYWKEMYHTVSHGAIWHGEVCNVAKNGSYYWVDTTIVPFMDEHKKPVSYIAIRTDITERKAIQDSLSKAMQLQKAIFENAGVAIITTDIEGMITGFNAAAEEMLGYKAQELIGKESPAIFHKLEEVVYRAKEFSQELGEVVEPGFKVFVIKAQKHLPNAHEWIYVCKDGSEVPVYLNVTALYDADGKTSGYMGIASNVSLFKEAEQQMLIAKEAAESSAQIKSEFLATMSHEIRTPMNGVLGMLGLLSHSNLDDTQRHQVRVASNSANSLLGLINDILDFSKVEAGKMELEMIEFNLRDELGEFIEAIAFRAQEKGLELILDTTKLTRSSVITDPGRLRQILTNLVGNAVKFTHRGEVFISVVLDEVDAHHGRLRINVRDSGIGISADKIDSLFETFSQADNSTTRKYGGTGLGLAIVKKLCEIMDGKIWVTSVEHEGSTFHIDIGVGLGELSALSIPSMSVADKSVLVVDDNETNRAVVRAQLENWGMKVYEAEDPIIAFDYCQIRIAQGHIPPYDVALLDMQMPNMDGADLGEEIRNIRQCDDMKMIMMTSLGSRNDAQRFAQIGFDAFFAKPTTTKDLLNALKVLFDEGEALEGATPLVTKDYLGTLQENTQIQWPADIRILLVEDNTTNQIVAQGMLGMIGLEADVACNGLEALEAMQLALETVPYTLLLMDCQMPEMDGYTASTAIREGRAGEAYTKIPIIAMTANAMAGDREKCLIAGMSDYVTKPINIDTLRAALLKWLKGSVVADEPNVHPRKPKAKPIDKEVQELKLWDEADALKRLGGKKELLIKIIQSFLDEGHRMTNALGTAITQGDLPNIQLHAHSIKGSASNVSAQQLQALAKTIEFSAKNGNKSTLKKEFVNLEKAMQEVCAVFEKVLKQEVRPVIRKKRMDSLQMAVKLQNLKKEIEAGAYIDTDALDIFGDYTDEEFTVHMRMLKGHIDRFDTPEALALLETIMAGLE
ncbi:MAG: response regulator [Sulfuricurvum sp.]|nr:response regulator [Sulfuricurvum sp.]